jgi:hypothetical protein
MGLAAYCSLLAPSVEACEACREALGKLGLAKAYNWSIVLMLAVPALVIFVISSLLIKAYRRADREQTSSMDR